LKFLVVDDSSTMRRIIKNTLKKIGINPGNILEASDGAEAWQALQEDPDISVVLTDWNMPNMNGLELVNALKAGVNNYIVKPFTPNVLKEKLERIL
jgi:two-component system chemotaxis response regulator CheY